MRRVAVQPRHANHASIPLALGAQVARIPEALDVASLLPLVADFTHMLSPPLAFPMIMITCTSVFVAQVALLPTPSTLSPGS